MATVLVVEDQKEIQEVLIEALEIQSYHVLCADNGKRALELMAEVTVDVLVTDIIMPALTGLSLIKEAKKINPNIHTIAISGGGRVSSEDYLKSAEHLGVDATFSKPFDIFKLCDKVKELTQNSPEG